MQVFPRSAASDAARISGRRGLGRAGTAVAVGAALAATALWVRRQNRRAERQHPPFGRFIEVDGVRLHYVEHGSGTPLVLLHGNGTLVEELELSGWPGLAADRYRVIAFDRPGFGYSERPRSKSWTPEEQANLLRHALQRLGIEQAIVLGHSWGTLVALALALNHPQFVRGLVLASGYYYPSARIDALLLATPALPLVGDLMRYTVSPLATRLLWPLLVRRIFGPQAPSPRFAGFPVWLALRPGQLRAAAQESGLMIGAAQRLSRRYQELTMPLAIVAGDGDRIADARYHSGQLHRALPHSSLRLVPGVGHMVYYHAARDLLAAVDTVAKTAAAGAETADANTAPAQRPLGAAPLRESLDSGRAGPT